MANWANMSVYISTTPHSALKVDLRKKKLSSEFSKTLPNMVTTDIVNQNLRYELAIFCKSLFMVTFFIPLINNRVDNLIDSSVDFSQIDNQFFAIRLIIRLLI